MKLNMELTTARFTLLLSVVLVALYNQPLWSEVARLTAPMTPGTVVFLASFFLLLVALLNFLLSLFAFKYVLKPVAIAVLIVTAALGFFMSSYGVMVEDTMIRNLVETDAKEAFDLVSPRLLLHLVLFGVLPALLVWRLPIAYRPIWGEMKLRVFSVLLSVGVVGGVAFAYYQDYVSLFRNNQQLKYLFTPVNFISAGVKYVRRLDDRNIVVAPIGTDAARGEVWAHKHKKTLFVLVVGETARAQNFSLGGYARPTNAYLRHENVAYFRDVHSCGTATAVSLPCMFSNMGRERYDSDKAHRHEGLLDVLRHAGLRVLWRDNNSGCKGACARVDTQPLEVFRANDFCDADHCYDEVLLNGLDKYLAQADGDAVVVLHQNGSHGPAYYRRYPKQFERFTPVCATNELQKCTQEQIANTYDNTILYTDYFLSRVIGFLKARSDRYDTAMIYVSDHGESLGEHHIYLHGLPYFIAPEEQKRVPMIVWMSDGFGRGFGIDRACVGKRTRDTLSHDNLFHSVLGMLDVKTAVYDAKLDLFDTCRTPTITAKKGAPVPAAQPGRAWRAPITSRAGQG